jgi:hypothetical protein
MIVIARDLYARNVSMRGMLCNIQLYMIRYHALASCHVTPDLGSACSVIVRCFYILGPPISIHNSTSVLVIYQKLQPLHGSLHTPL